MYKLIIIGLIVLVGGLYFVGALEIDSSGSSVDISIDKDKASELKESIAEQLEN